MNLNATLNMSRTLLNMPMKWRLAVVMAEKDMGVNDLAAITGLHRATISNLKNNLPSHIRMKTLQKICTALECQPGELLQWTPDNDVV
ncbi:helix-turn-helix transcriptional regulator [Planktothricoides sp. FACHB-1370]|uniref:Helix-turn-helix transcriptional regulator n=3 Tax=Planktothricoides raciborskii TaxID=132608 RepID=A0ABR8E900_9CYAN|nr:helix-turn-helix transcriptional regulator [Planktothricoides raciborskii FACHB-1370]MBD2585059.1 helix-turn-helix transcriptional regulator [Planktothricoides raciborskii FACHB-1261]